MMNEDLCDTVNGLFNARISEFMSKAHSQNVTCIRCGDKSSLLVWGKDHIDTSDYYCNKCGGDWIPPG